MPAKPTGGNAADGAAHERSVEQIYQKKTQLEHILLRPDTYVGSTERQAQDMFVFDEERVAIVSRKVDFVPALLKIFDEILVNAADNMVRDPHTMDLLEVAIDVEQRSIRVKNNGKGIPIQIHKDYGCYVPELIFGHLLTSDNYDDGERKVTGGRNGYGAKLANVFSTKFVVETADRQSKKKFRQVFEKNMMEKQQPEISSGVGEDYTSIAFWPDLARFGMKELDQDIVGLMGKRVCDVAACTGGKCRVLLNGRQLSINGFQHYVQMHLSDCGVDGGCAPFVHKRCNDRWEVAVRIVDGGFQQVSLVNSIYTAKGGTHVDYITEQIVEAILKAVRAKNRGGMEVKASHVRSHLWVFVKCLIENPAFDSQAKETLTTKHSKFGSTCELPDSMIKQVLKSGIVETMLDWAKAKQKEYLGRQLRGQGNQTRVHGVPKLEDANEAGGRLSQHCTLILTEGDSAKALAVAGLSVVGRDRYGVLPLKGKVMNVRDASYKQIMGNQEIQNLLKVVGLDTRVEYTSTHKLRYGHILLMTDQDHDGSHIKGLLINLFHHWWPSLLRLDGFLQEFSTPIVKVWREGRRGGERREERSFYNLVEYGDFKKNQPPGTWRAKYYKGLGTSTAQEAKEYFRRIEAHVHSFQWTNDQDGEAIDLAFNKRRADDRKEWINACEETAHVDHSQRMVGYHEFVHKELVHFAKYDVQRSVPSLVDGFKPSQRKVMYCAFKKRLTSDIKVAQFVGYISEQSAYHHGEASLENTIVNLAQNFVGSNNLNFLHPSGQFGTRLQGGKDRAAARYIYTRLASLTRLVFHPDDDRVLEHLEEEGQRIEPRWYCPVLPTVLVNGAEGIGVGWNTFVPNYSPREIIRNIRAMLRGEAMRELRPWYWRYRGSISASDREPGKFDVLGRCRRTSEREVEISELPVKVWTQSYRDFLAELLPQAEATPSASSTAAVGGSTRSQEPLLTGIREFHTETSVRFVATLTERGVAEVEKQGLEKVFRLKTSLSTANMVLFDAEGRLVRYESALDILRDFCQIRVEVYRKRKAHLVASLLYEKEVLSNKARFILMVVSGELELRNRKRSDLLKELERRGFQKASALRKQFRSGVGAPEVEEGEGGGDAEDNSDYDYLLDMSLWSLTYEKVEEIKAQREAVAKRLKDLEGTSVESLWDRDLEALSRAIDAMDAAEAQETAAAEAAAEACRRRTAAQQPPAAAGAAAEGSGKSCEAGEQVEYWSKSLGKWIPAVVLRVVSDGCVDLDVKKHAKVDSIRKLDGEEGPVEQGQAPEVDAQDVPMLPEASVPADPPRLSSGPDGALQGQADDEEGNAIMLSKPLLQGAMELQREEVHKTTAWRVSASSVGASQEALEDSGTRPADLEDPDPGDGAAAGARGGAGGSGRAGRGRARGRGRGRGRRRPPDLVEPGQVLAASEAPPEVQAKDATSAASAAARDSGGGGSAGAGPAPKRRRVAKK